MPALWLVEVLLCNCYQAVADPTWVPSTIATRYGMCCYVFYTTTIKILKVRKSVKS